MCNKLVRTPTSYGFAALIIFLISKEAQQSARQLVRWYQKLKKVIKIFETCAKLKLYLPSLTSSSSPALWMCINSRVSVEFLFTPTSHPSEGLEKHQTTKTVADHSVFVV